VASCDDLTIAAVAEEMAMRTIRSSRALLALLPLSLLFLAGCISIEINGEGFTGERGSGTLVSESRAVPSFSAVEVSGALRAEVTTGALAVDVVFDDNLIDKLETTVSGGVLQVSCRGCSPSGDAIIRVSAPEIVGIEVSGASDITAVDITGDRLELSLSGASRLEIDGGVSALQIEGSGASLIKGANLVTNRLEIDLSGATRAEVRVIDRAEGELSGASHLEVTGDEQPVIDIDLSGASSVNR